MLLLVFALGVAWLVWLCLKPVTVSLTFDDGLRAHYTVVAPLLEKYGWRGVFNVPTELIGPNPAAMTPEIAKSLGIEGHEDCLMSWDQVRDLIARGHEVYPHSCTHVNLKKLIEEGKSSVAEREIAEARRMFMEQTGVAPKFFCEPYLQTSPAVRKLIRRQGMKPFDCSRPGFGRAFPGEKLQDVLSVLNERRSLGRYQVSPMVHGVVKNEGGWRTYESIADFVAYLEAILDAERTGRFKVTRYDDSHFYGDWLFAKIRRICYYLIIKED